MLTYLHLLLGYCAQYILYCVLPFILALIIHAYSRSADRERLRSGERIIRDAQDWRDHGSGSDKKASPTKFEDLKSQIDVQEHTSFKYEALAADTHTRLITLLPGNNEPAIKCLLTATDLSKQPKYKALSYVWGEVDAAYGILLNGQAFPVGKLLWLALYRLRHTIKPQILWIDAICINQKDEVEKATQIRQMGNIYSQASTVLAWLGDKRNKNIDDAFNVMEMLHGLIPPSIRKEWGIFNRSKEGPAAAEALIERCEDFVEKAVMLLRVHPDSPLSMRLVLSYCPYWSRMWIIQEVLLAKNLVLCCGTKRFQWQIYSELRPLMHHLLVMARTQPHIRFGIDWSEISTAFDVHGAAKFDKLRRDHINESGAQLEYDVKELIDMSISAQCFTARDRIYGCLGVIKEPNMPVDYDRAMFEVFTDALQHIKHASVRGEGTLYDFYTVRFAQLIQASLKGPFTDTRERSVFFKICGFQTGTIESIGTTCTANDDFSIVKAKLECLFENKPSATCSIPFTRDPFDTKGQYAKLEAQTYARKHNLPPAHEISPIMTKTTSIYESRCMDAIHPWNAAYFKAVTRPYSTNDISQERSSPDIPCVSTDTDTTESPSLLPPKFFLTTTLGFGLCPESSLPGDIVVQFLNSDTAAILRLCEDLKLRTHYRLIGRAFVGRDGGVDATMKMIGSPNNDALQKHGSIVTEEEVAERGLTSCVEMVVDGQTLQHLTACLDWWTGDLRMTEIDWDDFMRAESSFVT